MLYAELTANQAYTLAAYVEYARALHGYDDTLLECGKRGEYTYQKGLAYLREAGKIFADCQVAIDLEWVEAVLGSSQSRTIVQ